MQPKLSPLRPRRGVVLLVLSLVLVAALPGGAISAAAGPIYLPMIVHGAPTPTTAHLTPVASGLSAITDIAHAGDARLFIVEQTGRIRVLQNDAVLAAPFLDITARVACCGERGLLGLAFHPAYATNGYFFVNYTYTAAGGQLRSRVARFTVSGDPNVADATSEQVILEFNQPATNHNGGALHFGPDGYLYIASGDGGAAYDPPDNSQNTANLLGKVLRIDVNAMTGAGPDCSVTPGNYRIPPNNPLADGSGGACDEIWAYGLRNPWRFSFDRLTGDLWIADVGQGAREEIDFAAAGDAGGRNYGWDCWEGTLRNTTNDPAPACAANPLVVSPVHEYDHGGGKCSITGGYVYRGAAFAGFQGLYFFADYCSGEVWTLRRTGGAPAVTALTLTGPALANPRTFGQDAAGELYVASSSEVYRIDDGAAARANRP